MRKKLNLKTSDKNKNVFKPHVMYIELQHQIDTSYKNSLPLAQVFPQRLHVV